MFIEITRLQMLLIKILYKKKRVGLCLVETRGCNISLCMCKPIYNTGVRTYDTAPSLHSVGDAEGRVGERGATAGT